MTLSASQSRGLALLLLLLVVAVLVAALAVPTWLLHRHYDTAIEDASDRLQRYQRVAALRPAIEEATRAVEARGARQYYLKTPSLGLAAAEMQGSVTRIIDAHKGKIISSQALPVKETGKPAEPQRVAISVQMSSAILPLSMILHAIETSQPYLYVEQLSVFAHQGRGYKPVPGIEPEYVVHLTVYGYTPPGGGKP
jgi:general secretion pathway protein M